MKKQIISTALAVMMLSSVCAAADSINVASGNSEVSGWAVNELRSADSLELIPADLKITDFTEPVRRDDFCDIAAKLIYERGHDITVSSETAFSDTDSAAVAFMEQNGILEGRGDGSFDPDAKISREEAASILYRISEYLGISEQDGNEFVYADDNEISDWARDAIYSMYSLDVMKGTGDDRFSPQDSYSVEQTIITMLRLYNAADKIDDPTTKEGHLNSDRMCPKAVTVGNNIYVIGGYDADGEFVDSIEVSRDSGNRWAQTESSDHILPESAAAADEREIYIIGGEKDGICTDEIYSFNVKSRIYDETGSVGEPIKAAEAVYNDGMIYVVNAQNDSGRLDHMIVHQLESGENISVTYPEAFDETFAAVCGGRFYLFGKIDGSTKVYSFNGQEWNEETFDDAGISVLSVLSNGEDIYIISGEMSNIIDVYKYDPERATCEILMDGYIRDISDPGYALHDDYIYFIGGINGDGERGRSEQYDYTWSCVGYDPSQDSGLPVRFGSDWESTDRVFDIHPKITGVDAKILDREKGIYELSMDGQYTCDPDADPYFFWSAGSGNFDGANANYSRVIYHSDPNIDSYITVGIGDHSGFTDKARFSLPATVTK